MARGGTEHFQAKWVPVRVKKMRQNRKLEPRSDSIGTERALEGSLAVATVLPVAPESLNAAAPAPLRILLDGIDRLGRLDGWIGGGCLLTLTLLMLAEVTTRFLSNFLPFFPPTISIAWEYSSYLMAACFTFGAAMTLRVGGHIRVVLLLKNVPAPVRRGLEILSAFAGFVFM